MMEYVLLNFILLTAFIAIVGLGSAGQDAQANWGIMGSAWLFRVNEILRIAAMPFP